MDSLINERLPKMSPQNIPSLRLLLPICSRLSMPAMV